MSQTAQIAASLAYSAPTTTTARTGLIIYEMVRIFAIFLSSSIPASLTCTMVISFIAGGPVGMSIMANQSIGSDTRILEFFAKA